MVTISKKFLTLAMQLLLFAVILIGKNFLGEWFLTAGIVVFGISCLLLYLAWKEKTLDEKELIAYGYLFLGLETIAIGLQSLFKDFKNLPVIAGIVVVFFLVFFL